MWMDLSGPRSIGAYQRWGGFASYAVAPLEACPTHSGRCLSMKRAVCLATMRPHITVWLRAETLTR